jgi:hypothetical protein
MRSESWKFQEQATDAAEDEGPIEATTIQQPGTERVGNLVAVGQTVSIVSPAQKHVARRYLRLTGGNRSGLTLYHTPESLS